jgi:putative transposase
MVHYRRARVAGASYFLTLTLADRRSDLLVRHIHLLRSAFRRTLTLRPFQIEAVVVLPDHLHLLMTLPKDDADYSTRVSSLKAGFVGALRKQGHWLATNARREANVWQSRFWEHLIRDERDFVAHVDYVHLNPVKHGLVGRVIDWPHSSFHRYLREGRLPPDWSGGCEEQAMGAQE